MSFFGLDRGEQVQRSKDKVVIDVRIWSERKDYGAGAGRLEVGYHNRHRVAEAFGALRCFAVNAELDALAQALSPHVCPLLAYDYYFDSRNKVILPGIEIVMYKEKWTFKLSAAVASELMLFVGEYGAQ